MYPNIYFFDFLLRVWQRSLLKASHHNNHNILSIEATLKRLFFGSKELVEYIYMYVCICIYTFLADEMLHIGQVRTELEILFRLLLLLLLRHCCNTFVQNEFLCFLIGTSQVREEISIQYPINREMCFTVVRRIH